jgi:hypothetical protein
MLKIICGKIVPLPTQGFFYITSGMLQSWRYHLECPMILMTTTPCTFGPKG